MQGTGKITDNLINAFQQDDECKKITNDLINGLVDYTNRGLIIHNLRAHSSPLVHHMINDFVEKIINQWENKKNICHVVLEQESENQSDCVHDRNKKSRISESERERDQ
jgi:uncharacterized membrane-anchored protein